MCATFSHLLQSNSAYPVRRRCGQKQIVLYSVPQDGSAAKSF
jgi:hypothetical protein